MEEKIKKGKNTGVPQQPSIPQMPEVKTSKYEKVEWISVKKRLPEERIVVNGFDEINKVLICGIFSTTGKKEIRIGFYSNGTWYIGDMNSVGGKVLAWMPKPEPPENFNLG